MPCRSVSCARTPGYGGFHGNPFTDFPCDDPRRPSNPFIESPGISPGPCGVDIVEIRMNHSAGINSIQVTYRDADGDLVTKPRRGQDGGQESIISLEAGERITGVAGIICTRIIFDLPIQLVFFSEKEDGRKVVYGPYGGGDDVPISSPCRLFAVNGKITSIFGRALIAGVTGHGNVHFVDNIGFYYEDESLTSQHT